jgi:hypothetical protein
VPENKAALGGTEGGTISLSARCRREQADGSRRA